MIKIEEKTATVATSKTLAIWQQAFRPFFLAGNLFSVAAISVWIGILNGTLAFSPYGNPVFWHGHEMLFGFVGAIVAGFLMTAVQTWTGLRAIHGKPLIAVFLLWLLARLLMTMQWRGIEWVVLLVDVSFFPAVGVFVAMLVIKAKNYRNLVFIPVLGLMACANLLTHLSIILERPEFFAWGMHAAIVLATLLVVVVGGRVIPLFTANGTRTPQVQVLLWLERTVMISVWLIAFLYISNGSTLLPRYLLAAIFTLAAVSNAFRALRWFTPVIFSNALVWSLHLAYWFIPVSFSLFALHFAGYSISATTALHGLTAGAMASLILAMTARVSLGHSGRPLVVHRSLKYAFALIVIAGITRLVFGLYPGLLPAYALIISGALWVIAYSIYSLTYFRILTTPRADGKPG